MSWVWDRRICGACVVRAQCAAASVDEPAGIWAGTTGQARRATREEATG